MTTVADKTDLDHPGEPSPETESRPRSPILPMIAGIVLLSAGLGAIGYGAFQLVVTDIIAARAQTNLATDFDARVTASDAVMDRLGFLEAVEERNALIADDDDPTFAATSGQFDNADDIPIMVVQGDPNGLDPRIPQVGLPWIYETAPPTGEALGRIVIPQADVDWVVVEGVTQTDLRKGPGHMPYTALPGQLGNAVISGHRTTYGAPFFELQRLEPGDRFTVETVAGTHTYEVVETRIVEPTDVWVTGQWEGAWLTLTTCNPRYSAQERLIVFSKMVDGPNFESVEVQFDRDYVVPDPPGA